MLNAFNITRAGGDAPLFDQILNGMDDKDKIDEMIVRLFGDACFKDPQIDDFYGEIAVIECRVHDAMPIQ